MRPVIWKDNKVEMIDQRILPTEEVWLTYEDAAGVAEAILTMVVRGAPAIGIAAAYGLALETLRFQGETSALVAHLEVAAQQLDATRPTAINLKWALERMLAVARAGYAEQNLRELQNSLVAEAKAIAAQDEAMCKAMGDHGATLIPEGAKVLTHCNAGALATGDYGTALGVIRSARDKIAHVWVDETRPFLQGARLTAWELMQDGIPCRLICDNMAAHFMQRGQVDAVVVGADRITSSGAVANKIGTYNLAVLCRFHEIPFYVAAPYSTIDMGLSDGRDIPIEERPISEVTHIKGQQVAPDGVPVANPAFDVTPPDLVSAIITERGIIKPPFQDGLRAAVAAAGSAIG